MHIRFSRVMHDFCLNSFRSSFGTPASFMKRKQSFFVPKYVERWPFKYSGLFGQMTREMPYIWLPTTSPLPQYDIFISIVFV